MKKLKGMCCIIFLYMMAGTLTVHADDNSFNTGAGITFEGSMETEKPTEKSTEKTERPMDKSTDSVGSSKPSLPQTGQESGLVLQTAGVIILLLVCWWTVVKSREKAMMSPERNRAGLSEDYGTG